MFQSIPRGYEKGVPGCDDCYERIHEEQPRSATSEDFKRLILPSVVGDNPSMYQSQNNSGNRGDIERFGGYFPLVGLYVGGKDMWNAISVLYNKTILQDNILIDLKKKPIDNEHYLVDKTIVPINLSAVQKASLVARCAMVWVRGLITFCQLGVVFAPFDAFANWWYKEPSK